MEDNEVKGKVTVIIQSKEQSTHDLEINTRTLFSNEGSWYIGDEDEVDIFIVPSDDI